MALYVDIDVIKLYTLITPLNAEMMMDDGKKEIEELVRIKDHLYITYYTIWAGIKGKCPPLSQGGGCIEMLTGHFYPRKDWTGST